VSAFEFILILIAIVAGFAISEILAAWGRLIHARVALRHSALYCSASFLLLAIIVRYVWLLWILRGAEWGFLSFVLTFTPMLVLALAAYVIALPRETAPDVPEYYFAQARPYYVLLAVFTVVWTIADLLNASERDLDLAPSSLLAGRAVLTAGLLALAHTKSQALHWLFISAFAAGLVGLSIVAVPKL
jgi:hypothetical protein